MAAMRWASAAAGLLLCIPISASIAQPLPPEVLLLGRIKAKAAENLQRLPNYTCTQTIERSHRNAKSRKFELLDTIRLEVALVEGKELFSWPGGKFEEKGIGEIVGAGGAIGNELLKELVRAKQPVRLVGRNPKAVPGVTETVTADLSDLSSKYRRSRQFNDCVSARRAQVRRQGMA